MKHKFFVKLMIFANFTNHEFCLILEQILHRLVIPQNTGNCIQKLFCPNFSNFHKNKQNFTKDSCEIEKKQKHLVICRQAEAYEQCLLQMLRTPWPMQSCWHRDVCIKFPHSFNIKPLIIPLYCI